MKHLPDTGLLRLWQIIGRGEITEEQARQNRQRGKGPKRPRPAEPPLIPVSASAWWEGCRQGRWPKPIKIGGATFWRVEELRRYL